MSEKLIIGRKEWVRFPDLKIGKVMARVDTGARSSSLHATDIEEFERDGEAWVKFRFIDDNLLEAKLWKQKYVKSSNGKKQNRYFIITRMVFGSVGGSGTGKVYNVRVSLTDRDSMEHSMLLGRRMISKRFLVDVSKTFVLG